MGFSVSGGTVVILLGLLVAFTIAYPAAMGGVERVSEAQDRQGDRLVHWQNAEIDFDQATYDDANATVAVRANNTGTIALNMNRTDLLFDGTYVNGANRSILDAPETGLWLPGETIVLTVDDVTSAPDRAKVVGERGLAVAGPVEVSNG